MAFIYQEGLSFILSTDSEEKIKIPSQKFPLNGSPQLFTAANTETVSSAIVREVFNATQFEMGHCYQNTDRLIQGLRSRGIDAQSYVGWITVGGDIPVHHCFCVVNGNQVLDPGVFLRMEDFPEYEGINPTETGELLMRKHFALQNSPNSDCCGFGKVDSLYAYIACPCSPADGRKIFQRLMRSFPRHPAYSNIDREGMSPLQRKIKDIEESKNNVFWR